MSTPPNPPSTPVGPPTEPAGTPIPETPETPDIPETDSVPAPAQPLSPEKTPAAPRAPEAAAPQPAPTPSGFAPLTPAAPTPDPAPAPAPAGFSAPAAPGTPWGGPTPGHPGAPYPGRPGYPHVAPTGNGLAVASLITGGFGILLGVVPFLFWAGTLIAAVGLGLGIGGVVRANKGAPNKSVAVVGTVLSVLGLFASVGGLFLTFLVVDSADSRLDRQVEADLRQNERHPGSAPSAPSPTRPAAPTQVPGLTSALPFGESFTYPNGVTVSLSAPTKYEPKNAYDRKNVKNAVQITVTVTNHSTAPFEVRYVHPDVRDERGVLADPVYGFGMPKTITGALMPGETASGVDAFELPKGTENITAEISPGILLDKVKYAGAID
ncbi:uncharacterized protein DUF4352 [Streptomyces sp. CG 926]|uniref:DUF4352 domain-containing protein n=1 Tax=Streptomyces sp. CG 926 TaxID=1882405 RepID=UPI000D6AAA80|nr:DUF4352 domain-containing protein [Streptomyces sp. CG 926]PWK73415.1 uncharacterized protein DUF4352 [Streptomyces sp. CG 926]